MRRDLTPDEFIRALQTAICGPVVKGVSGEDRAMAYCLAAGTGFRRKELNTLTPESFQLTANAPSVTVIAGSAKNRHEAIQEIRQDLAKVLRPWLANKPPGKPVLLLPHKCGNMPRLDALQKRPANVEADLFHERNRELVDLQSANQRFDMLIALICQSLQLNH